MEGEYIILDKVIRDKKKSKYSPKNGGKFLFLAFLKILTLKLICLGKK